VLVWSSQRQLPHHIEEQETFCINVLREGQHQISSNFGGAKPVGERFAEGDWREQDGASYLADARR